MLFALLLGMTGPDRLARLCAEPKLQSLQLKYVQYISPLIEVVTSLPLSLVFAPDIQCSARLVEVCDVLLAPICAS